MGGYDRVVVVPPDVSEDLDGGDIAVLTILDPLSCGRMAISKDLDVETLAYLRDLFGASCESFHSPKKAPLLPADDRVPPDFGRKRACLPDLLKTLCSFIITHGGFS